MTKLEKLTALSDEDRLLVEQLKSLGLHREASDLEFAVFDAALDGLSEAERRALLDEHDREIKRRERAGKSDVDLALEELHSVRREAEQRGIDPNLIQLAIPATTFDPWGIAEPGGGREKHPLTRAKELERAKDQGLILHQAVIVELEDFLTSMATPKQEILCENAGVTMKSRGKHSTVIAGGRLGSTYGNTIDVPSFAYIAFDGSTLHHGRKTAISDAARRYREGIKPVSVR